MPPSNDKKEFQSFLGIMAYLEKLSPSTAELCKLLKSPHHQNMNGHGTGHTKAYIKEPRPVSKRK